MPKKQGGRREVRRPLSARPAGPERPCGVTRGKNEPMRPEQKNVSLWGLAAIVAPLALLLAIGLWVYRTEAASARDKAEQQLAAIAHLKVDRLVAWQRERLDDAAALGADALWLGQTARFLATADARLAGQLRNRLRTVGAPGQYVEVLLVDAAGRVRLSTNGDSEPPGYAAALALALGRRHPVFSDLFVTPHCRSPRVALIAPFFVPNQRTGLPLGAVVLISDAVQCFQSWLQPWGPPGATGEILLVRRDGSPLLLAESLPRLSVPLPSQMSGRHSDSLAAAAMQGRIGAIRGRDQQGVDSLAVIVPVPGTEWRVIAKDAAAHVFAAWRFRAALLLLVFALLAGGFGGLCLFMQQYNKKVRYMALYDAESRLRHSMERHRSTVQAIDDGIIAADGQGRIELINPVAEALTGWRQEEALGRPLEEVFCLVEETTGELVRGSIAQVLGSGTAGERKGYHLLRARDGRERAVTGSVAPIHDDRNTPLGIVLAFRDQTEERQAQRLMQARLFLREYAFTHTLEEFFLRALKEVAALMESPLVFCRCPEQTVSSVVMRRPPSSRTTAFAQAGNGWVTVSGIDWMDAWFDRLGTGQPPVVDDPGVSAGSASAVAPWWIKGKVLAVPVLRAGKVLALFGVAEKSGHYSPKEHETLTRIAEFTWRLVERKQVEEELLASERQYRTLYRSMMDAFVVTDMHGHIRQCNDAYCAMLGYDREELRRMRVSDVTPAQWLAYEDEQVRNQLMHGGCSGLYEKEYRRKDGTLIPVELRTFLLIDNDGQPEGMSAVVRDISERKRAEQEEAKLLARLSQSQKMESVGQLAGGVAHDFNNMLSVILGYAELALRKMEVPEPLHGYLEEIVKAGRRSSEITRQLLAFARQQTIAPRILDLNETVEGMLKMLRRLIGEDVVLRWVPTPDLWPIRMDPTQVDQLLANLCVNARDAIAGVGKITIETGRATFDQAYCAGRSGVMPGDFVLLAVSDNGSGIERDLLDKIFEPFFTTKDVGRGTGLGLATVYGIVKQNEGFINVYSEPGVGTTFRIYLPRQIGTVEDKPEIEAITAMPTGQGQTVLVVEDEEAMLTLNRSMLEYLGYTVLTAGTPGEALRLAKAHCASIELLVVDVIMPEMNGRELSKEIETLCPRVKTLFTSGYTANVIAHRAVLDKGVRFMTKPFSTGELARKVWETLHG